MPIQIPRGSYRAFHSEKEVLRTNGIDIKGHVCNWFANAENPSNLPSLSVCLGTANKDHHVQVLHSNLTLPRRILQSVGASVVVLRRRRIMLPLARVLSGTTASMY